MRQWLEVMFPWRIVRRWPIYCAWDAPMIFGHRFFWKIIGWSECRGSHGMCHRCLKKELEKDHRRKLEGRKQSIETWGALNTPTIPQDQCSELRRMAEERFGDK